MMDNNKLYIPAQITFFARRNDAGELLEEGTTLCIKSDSTEDAFRQYRELKSKLNGELGKPNRVSSDENKPLHFPQQGVPCPECGSALIRRVAKSGMRAGQAFVGCSSFPNCHYIQNGE